MSNPSAPPQAHSPSAYESRSSLPLTLPIPADDSPSKNLTPVSSVSKLSHCETNPYSAFYCHPTTRYSFEIQKSESKPIIHVHTIDVEAAQGRLSNDTEQQRKDCEVWPGKHTLRENRLCRRQRGLKGRWQRIDKKTKTWIKILLAILFVGGMIGIGLGVSKAVGGGVWKGQKQSNAQIGDGKRP
ncbi:MAG: hypothetical protein M1814_000962 [Vezdaea aestivalis]|nr:MAG: hypothetical protein M1814_000962 [Vezdaea aestivalis]